MRSLIIALFLAFQTSSGVAGAATMDQDVERYVKVFQGDKARHAREAETLGWAGLSDARIFDRLETLLLADFESARNSRYDRNRCAWYIRALAFSGQDKYVPTISRFVKDDSYDGYARTALAELPQYQKWNPVISNRANFDPKLPDEVNRLLNMLRSDDFMLKRLAAKRIYFQNKDEVLLDELATQIRAGIPLNTRKTSDPIAWMVKALGRARSEKHRPLLIQARDDAADAKVRDYAERALSEYR